MSGLELNLVNGDVTVPSLMAMAGRKLARASGEDMVDLPRAIVLRWERVSKALDKVLDAHAVATRDWPANMVRIGEPGHYDLLPLLEAFEQYVFRAAELFEVYEKEIIRGIAALSGRNSAHRGDCKAYKTIVDAARKEWAMMCNRIKHNENVIASKTVRYTMELMPVVFCFSLLEPKDDQAMLVSKLFHRGSEMSRSIVVAIFQSISDLFRCDRAAASLIRKLADDCEVTMLEVAPASSLIHPFRKLDSSLAVTSPSESPMFDRLSITGPSVKFHRASARRGVGPYSVHIAFNGDGISRIYEYGV